MSAFLQNLENITVTVYENMLTHSYLCDALIKTAVTPYTWNNLRTNEWIFIKFNTGKFQLKLVNTFKSWLNLTTVTETLHDDLEGSL
jgi:hypothetical protein